MHPLQHKWLAPLAALWPARPTAQDGLYAAILFVVYIAAAQFGAALFTSPAVISPAPAVALAGLFLAGLRFWPVIFFASFVNLLLHGSSSPVSLLLYPLAQTLQAVVGAYLLTWLNFDPVLRRLNDMLVIVGVALVASTVVPTLWLVIRYTGELVGAPLAATGITWGSWWVGYFLSLLVVAPLILRWVAKPRLKRTRAEWAETALLFAILGTISYFLFWTPYTSVLGVSLLYLLLGPLFWIAIRFGPRFTILSIFLVTTVGLGGMILGPQAPAATELGSRLFQAEILFIILAFIFYIVTALQEERRTAVRELTSYITQLEKALNQLSMQDRAKSDFVAVLAHELRNPLAPIVSSLELLRLQVPGNPQNEEVLDLMDSRLKTIQRLLDDLLDVSRISQAKLKLKTEQVALRPIIERSLQSVAHYLKARDQTLFVDLAQEPLVLEADPVRVEQILTNLLTNATKFTPTGGKISVYAKREGDTAVVRVVDTGVGIEPAMLEKVFEPFTQLSKSSEGLGIGLSLTQQLVEMHKGSVEVRSKGVDLGSEFEVRLPALRAATPNPAQPGRRGSMVVAAGVGGGKKVLIVDDNQVAAHGIGKLLEYKGFKVDFAYSGVEARQKTKEFNPAVVVLDIGLPDIDGYQVAQLMKKDGYRGMLIALTGYGQAEDKERAREAGFDHHLTKPISIADLEPLLA